MLQIFVNGRITNLLQPHPGTIFSIEINTFGIPIPIPHNQVKPIAAWLYDLTQRTENAIIYNKVYIQKEDVTELHKKD